MYNYSKFQKGQKAVALGFDIKKDDAPKVLAIGRGQIAENIIQIAKDSNIPTHTDADLVEILSVLDIDEYIPVEVYSVVAEIFTHIYQLNEKKKQRKLKNP
jgi:flagellar biosynthesis protein